MTEQTKKQITALALANGFKLKAQPDGSMALNPYVFDFAHAVAASAQPPQQSAQPEQQTIDAKDAEIARLREVLEGIHRYGLDTLSGRTDGADDRNWQRAGVNEMTKRARLGLKEKS